MVIFIKIIETFDGHCIPHKNITFLRKQFFTPRQVGQLFDEFVTSLRKLSADCEFGDLN